MEAIERYSGEPCDRPVYSGTRLDMERLGPSVDPAELTCPRLVASLEDVALEWVEGLELLSRQVTSVPLNPVPCPYEPGAGDCGASSRARTDSRRATPSKRPYAMPSGKSSSAT